jgi:hypothetical protein
MSAVKCALLEVSTGVRFRTGHHTQIPDISGKLNEFFFNLGIHDMSFRYSH